MSKENTMANPAHFAKASGPRKFMECRDAPGRYKAALYVSADDILIQARAILSRRCATGRSLIGSRDVRDYLMHELAGLDHEVFGAIFLDQRHRLIGMEILFRGAVNGVDVKLREVARRALWHNASALIVFHNHPSGDARPSHMDEILTARLKAALGLVDVQLLDHFVVAGGWVASMAELGFACFRNAPRAPAAPVSRRKRKGRRS